MELPTRKIGTLLLGVRFGQVTESTDGNASDKISVKVAVRAGVRVFEPRQR